ncbi:MAG: hypothetical protein HY873_04915 [Chloroflexi bacterium]|nr:hypothetical protein [Chloroflexota bacterium]
MARGGTRLFERLPSQRQMFHTSAGSFVQDRVLARYREVMREEATRRQHREGMRRAAFIAAGLLATAGGAVVGYRKTVH